MIERHEKFLGHFCPKTNCFPQIFYIMQRFFLFFVVKSWKEKKINSHGMEQAKTMSIVHTWMLTKINNQSWLTNTLLCNHLKLVLLLGGYLSISRSNLFTNSWLFIFNSLDLSIMQYQTLHSLSQLSWYVSKICIFHYVSTY